ncbi:MAG: P1 family peptidase [Gemmatimonadota bacterium]
MGRHTQRHGTPRRAARRRSTTGTGANTGSGRQTVGTLPLALSALLVTAGAGAGALRAQTPERPRARELGIRIGRLPSGPLDAITDVAGVRVGHATLVAGDSIRTGVTAILPRSGNLFRNRVRAAIAVGNGFGKLVGLSQVNELGELETPILLTGTLSVFRAADALLDTLLAEPANREVRSMNPVVGETNDGFLSDIRVRPIRPEHVRAALRDASGGPVEEGSVGAGTGTVALGWKGGIGTASRRVAASAGGFTVGVLVQTNYGGDLRIAGVPAGRELGTGIRGTGPDGGSVMIVVATDAPLAHRELQRLAYRAFLGIARTGSFMSHGSGDYAIAFSTSSAPSRRDPRLLSSLFEAVVEATEEAVLNSLLRATTVKGFRGHEAQALPVERVLELLRRAGRRHGAPER